MKILTVLGTRPEIIRLSRVIPRLDEVARDHYLLHTGQNHDHELSGVFFDELRLRPPDESLSLPIGAPLGSRVGAILAGVDATIRKYRPDRLLVLGDTDSGLSAIIAKRFGVRVVHMEAGNRCFNDAVPEEVNRRIIDHSSDILLPYTEHARRNLLREGVPPGRIFVTGNPIGEVLAHQRPSIASSTVLADLGVGKGQYLLLTAHRQETVDAPERLRQLVDAVDAVAAEFELPLVASIHPRTRDRLRESNIDWKRPVVPTAGTLGFHDFVALEQNARIVLTDSGTVQEECCLLGVPVITLRHVTERPETVEAGCNVLAGLNTASVLSAAKVMMTTQPDWPIPADYSGRTVSETVTRILLGV